MDPSWHWSLNTSIGYHTNGLRTATAHHGSLVLGYVPTEALFLFLVNTPLVLERVQRHCHDPVKDLSISLALDALNDLVKNPATRNELVKVSIKLQGNGLQNTYIRID